jgi:hypothetical protein
LKDPEPRRAPGSVKGSALAVKQEKDVLEQVIRFGGVSQDSVGYATYDASVSAEQRCEGFVVPLADESHQGFI